MKYSLFTAVVICGAPIAAASSLRASVRGGLRQGAHAETSLAAGSPTSWPSSTPWQDRIPDESATCYLYQDGFNGIPGSSCTATGFGKYSCKGPCWNMGEPTVCTTKTWHASPAGPWAEGTRSCKGSGGNVDYVCCPPHTDPVSGLTYEAKCLGSCKIGSNGGPVDGSCCCHSQTSTVVSVSDFKYDSPQVVPWDPSAQASSMDVSATFYGCNFGSTPLTLGSMTFSVTQTQSSSVSFTSTTGITIKTSFKTGVPFIAKGGLEIDASQSFSYGKAATKTNTLNTAVSTGTETIEPHSRQMIVFASKTTAYMIPFTAKATIIDNCGTRSYKDITGTVKVTGVAVHADGKISVLAGPDVPVGCSSPFDTPILEQQGHDFCPNKTSDMCSDNVLCSRNSALAGKNCGCTTKDAAPCCATARAHAGCSSYPENTLLCPNPNGYFDPCCSSSAIASKESHISFLQDIAAAPGKSADDAFCGKLITAGAGMDLVSNIVYA